MYFTFAITANLELNDALIIRDKSIELTNKINLTNGEVELVLITDSSVRRGRVIRPFKPIPIGGGGIVFLLSQ
jgi:hypothetical protein